MKNTDQTTVQAIPTRNDNLINITQQDNNTEKIQLTSEFSHWKDVNFTLKMMVINSKYNSNGYIESADILLRGTNLYNKMYINRPTAMTLEKQWQLYSTNTPLTLIDYLNYLSTVDITRYPTYSTHHLKTTCTLQYKLQNTPNRDYNNIEQTYKLNDINQQQLLLNN
jgi:hypothetical protein